MLGINLFSIEGSCFLKGLLISLRPLDMAHSSALHCLCVCGTCRVETDRTLAGILAAQEATARKVRLAGLRKVESQCRRFPRAR